MILPCGYDFPQYFEEIVLFLHKYSWLYEAPVTQILAYNIFSKIPEDWICCLLNVSNEELNEFPTGLLKDDFPQSLLEFCQDCRKLTLPALRSNVQLRSDDWLQSVSREIWRGMSPKKKEEVEILSTLVHQECMRLNINKIVDLGSGLGYIDRLLLLRGYKILGIESQDKLVKFASVQKDNFFPSFIANNLNYHNMRISNNVSSSVRSAILNQLLVAKDGQKKCNSREHTNQYNWDMLRSSTSDSNNSHKVCLIGLHTCGDLAVTGLRLYLEIPEVAALLMVPCCYNKMELSNSGTGKDSFHNFPLSGTLKGLSLGARFVCRPFLRLAGQATSNGWQGWSQSDHQHHAYNVLSRAVIQLFAESNFIDEERLTFKKCFRRIVKKTSLKEENFSRYIDESLSRCAFTKKDLTAVFHEEKKEEIRADLLGKWDLHKDKLRLVEVLTGLQMCLEPVAESLVVADRMCFLHENGADNVRVLRMMDSCISPRGLVYIVSK